MKERKLAVFDFDKTLIKGDSLWPFLTAVGGVGGALLATAEAASFYALSRYQKSPQKTPPEMRTYVKTRVLRKVLHGRKLSSLGRAIEKVRRWCEWNEPVRQKLMAHASEGHQIIIASGALNLYLPELLRDFPQHVLLCTQMAVKNGILTGEMASANCVREGKAEMLAQFLSNEEPYSDSWGYGNFPHDLPMFKLLKNKVIIG